MGSKDVHYTDPSRHAEPVEYEESTAEFVQNLQPIQEQKRRGKRNKIIFIVILCVALVGVGVYAVLLRPKKSQPTTQKQSTQQTAQAPATQTEAYSSSDLRIGFDYPKNWKVHDETVGLTTVESPVVQLKDAMGLSTNSKVVVSLLSTGSEIPNFKDTGAQAVVDSTKITYTKPSDTQRQQTYLSFLTYSSEVLDAVFVTGDNGYQKDQYVPEGDIKKGDPIVGVAFYACKQTDTCEGEAATPLGISADAWATDANLQAAARLVESLRVE
jgi:hypothetical protein